MCIELINNLFITIKVLSIVHYEISIASLTSARYALSSSVFKSLKLKSLPTIPTLTLCSVNSVS